MSLFDTLQPEAMDPIMAGFQEFGADRRADKINLGVGMYYDEDGRIPILRVVEAAERRLAGRVASWGYLMPDGLPALRDAAKRLVFGDALVDSMGDRIATVQSLGGTGALKLGADVIRRVAPDSTVAMSRPTWGNHPSIFQGAGLRVSEYPYFDPATGGVDGTAMRDAVAAMAPGTVLLLHACCHNPTGADLSAEDWRTLAGLIQERRLVPFLDMAYAGFAEGLEADSQPARLLAELGVPVFVATSFSKSFALYGERIGALSIVAADAKQAGLVLEQVKIAIRTNYSTPPSHGALLVSTHPGRHSAPCAVGHGAGRHAAAYPAHAGGAGRPAVRQQRLGFRPARAAEGAVFLLGPECGADGAVEGGVRHLWRQRRQAVHGGADGTHAGPGGGGDTGGGLGCAGVGRSSNLAAPAHVRLHKGQGIAAERNWAMPASPGRLAFL